MTIQVHQCTVRTASATTSGSCTILHVHVHVLESVQVCVCFFINFVPNVVSSNNDYDNVNTHTHNNNVVGIII